MRRGRVCTLVPSCQIHACEKGDRQDLPKNCPMRKDGYPDEIAREYDRDEDSRFYIESTKIESRGYGSVDQDEGSGGVRQGHGVQQTRSSILCRAEAGGKSWRAMCSESTDSRSFR